MARLKGVYDFTRQPLYDTVTLTTAALPTLQFFQNQIGAGIGSFGAATQAKTKRDTNLNLGGQLPAAFGFLVQGFRVATVWNIAAADFIQVFNGCYFEFSVAQKSFLTIPVQSIPAGNGPFGTVTALANSGYPSMSNMFALGLDDELPIEANMNFSVTLNWPGTAPTIATTGFIPTPGLPITVYMDGRLGRPVQ